MQDLDLSVTVTGGDLDDLALTAANGYRVSRRGLGPGAKSWQRQRATSIFVDGGVLVGQSRDMQTAVLHVRVTGASLTELAGRIETLIAALEQPSYQLAIAIDGVAFTWQCECADSAPGDAGLFDELELMSNQQVIRFTIPRQPTAVDGPL